MTPPHRDPSTEQERNAVMAVWKFLVSDPFRTGTFIGMLWLGYHAAERESGIGNVTNERVQWIAEQAADKAAQRVKDQMEGELTKVNERLDAVILAKGGLSYVDPKSGRAQ